MHIDIGTMSVERASRLRLTQRRGMRALLCVYTSNNFACIQTHDCSQLCGMISSYNSTDGDYPVKNLSQIFSKSLSLHGFTVSVLHDKYVERFYAEVPQLVAAGKIKYQEDVSKGLESVGDAILDVQKGRNKGKKVVVVAEE